MPSDRSVLFFPFFFLAFSRACALFSSAGAAGVLASPFAAMHGLGSPLTGPYGNSAVGGMSSVAAAHAARTAPKPGSLEADGPDLGLARSVAAAAAGMPLAGFSLPGAANALGAAGLRLTGQPGGSCVLLVSNLNEEVRTLTRSAPIPSPFIPRHFAPETTALGRFSPA